LAICSLVASISILSFILVPGPAAKAAEPVEKDVDVKRPSRPYLYLLGSHVKASDTTEQLDACGAGYGWGLGAGYFISELLSVEGELLWFRREYRRVSEEALPGTANNDLRALSLGVSVNARLSKGYARWRPFIGAGISYYGTDLLVTDPESGLFTDSGGPPSQSDTGWQVMVGVGIRLKSRMHLEVGWRRLSLEQDFGVFSGGPAEMGGDWLFIALRGGGY
jgi:opacity protein-like surface antigen